jgi:hypothetical protein
MSEIQQYENSIMQVNAVNEFVSAFAQQGVVFTDQEIEIIFNRYATKFRDVVEHVDKGKTE